MVTIETRSNRPPTQDGMRTHSARFVHSAGRANRWVRKEGEMRTMIRRLFGKARWGWTVRCSGCEWHEFIEDGDQAQEVAMRHALKCGHLTTSVYGWN